MRRLIVDLKAEHPALNPSEIARVCYVRFGRRPARKTVKRVLAEEPIPLRFVRRLPPYHEIPERRDGRAAVVALHADGWSAKAISGYLEVGNRKFVNAREAVSSTSSACRARPSTAS